MQPALFSISYAGLWGQAALDLRSIIRRAGELGFDAVMLAGKRPHLSPLDANDDLLAALRDELRTAGLTCPVVAAYTDLGAGFYALCMVSKYLGDQEILSPALAAWLPVFLFGPTAFVLFDAVHT